MASKEPYSLIVCWCLGGVGILFERKRGDRDTESRPITKRFCIVFAFKRIQNDIVMSNVKRGGEEWGDSYPVTTVHINAVFGGFAFETCYRIHCFMLLCIFCRCRSFKQKAYQSPFLMVLHSKGLENSIVIVGLLWHQSCST